MKQQTTGHRHGPLFLTFQYDYDYFLLGNKGYLGDHRINPRATLYTFDRRLETVLSFQYENRNYFEPLYSKLFNRDGDYFVFSLGQAVDLVDMTAFYRRLGIEPWGLAYDPVDPDNWDPENPKQDPAGYQRYLRPFMSVGYSWDSTRGAEYDCKRPLLTGGIDVPLPWGIKFDFSGQWEWENYQGFRGGDLLDFHRRGRDDFIQTYRFGLERRFVLVPGCRPNRSTIKVDRLVMTLRGDIRFTNDDSNVQDRLEEAVFSYDRAIYGLSVAFEFN
jgi:hypothetical protein